jgi:hypothetical protein
MFHKQHLEQSVGLKGIFKFGHRNFPLFILYRVGFWNATARRDGKVVKNGAFYPRNLLFYIKIFNFFIHVYTVCLTIWLTVGCLLPVSMRRMIYMKKLVAISVLLAGLAAAVFAQDEGKWKFGFSATYITDMLFTTAASGKSEYTTAAGTWKQEFGKYNKGTIEWFPNHQNGSNGTDTPNNYDNRLLLSISNSGDNYDVYGDIALDDWANDFSVYNFLIAGAADWYAKGTAGIFNGQIGTSGYGGWVSTYGTWNNWYKWNQLCRFGVWRANGPEDGFIVGNDFRTWNEWGNILALGIAPVDNIRVSLGYRLNPHYIHWSWGPVRADTPDPDDSKSYINGSFMLNGRAGDAIAFDLFYSVIGHDPNTFERPGRGTLNAGNKEATPDGMWSNIIGAYVGINAIDNLGLSLGYTANFNVYDKGSYLPGTETDPLKSKARTYTAPIYSGVDVRLNYSGLDKIGLTFNNNVTFAGVKGKGKAGEDLDEHVLGLGEGVTRNGSGDMSGTNMLNTSWGNTYDGTTYDWFHWDTELKATLALIENVNLIFHIGNRLGVKTTVVDVAATSTKTTTKDTDNTFQAVLSAEYGMGGITFGAGLFFRLDSTVHNEEVTGSAPTTFNGQRDVASFGIPVLLKVAF